MENSFNWIACYGAGLATITFLWNILRDRASLHLDFSLMRESSGSQILYLFCTATNRGHKTITVKGWGGQFVSPSQGHRKFLIIEPNAPRTMAPSDFVVFKSTDLVELRARNVRHYCVWDSHGVTWKASRLQMKRLYRELKQS